MRGINILNKEGFLTSEERKEKLEHGCEYFTFITCLDLSKPIRVIPFGSSDKFTTDQYSRDVASFICFWVHNIQKDLNGFSGFHNLKFEFVGFELISNRD